MKKRAEPKRPRSKLTQAERDTLSMKRKSPTPAAPKSALFSDYADDWVPSDEALRELVIARVQKLVLRLAPITLVDPMPKDVLRRVYELADEGNDLVGMLHDGWLVERGEKKARSRKFSVK